MKVLNFCVSNVETGLLNESGLPTNGRAKALLDVHEILKDSGIQSFIADVRGSALDCQHFYSRKTYRKDIEDILNSIKPEAVIVHECEKTLSVLNKMGIPCLYIDHSSHHRKNKLFIKKWVEELMPLNRSFGGRCVTVSENTKKFKEIDLKDMFDLSEPFYQGSVHLQFVTKELSSFDLAEKQGFICTIGRASPEKNLHQIFSVSKRLNIPRKVFTTYDKENSKVREYFEEHFAKSEGVYLNASRNETLRSLASASIFLSTCRYESAGIAAFEALCLGVPVYFHLDPSIEHSSEMFCPLKKAFAKKGEHQRLLDLTIEDRKEIAEATRSFNSKERVLRSILSQLEKIPPIEWKNEPIF